MRDAMILAGMLACLATPIAAQDAAPPGGTPDSMPDAPAVDKKHGLAANGNGQGMDVTALFGWEVIMTALFLLTIFTVTRKGADPGFHGLAILG